MLASPMANKMGGYNYYSHGMLEPLRSFSNGKYDDMWGTSKIFSR